MDRYAAIITGDRHGGSDWVPAIIRAIEPLEPEKNPVVIIHGDAPGVDTVAADVLSMEYPGIVLLPFPALWNVYRGAGMEKAAGPDRNRQMLWTLQGFGRSGWQCAVLGFHPFIHNSRGTANMLTQARNAGFHTRIYKKDGSWERW